MSPVFLGQMETVDGLEAAACAHRQLATSASDAATCFITSKIGKARQLKS